MNKIDQVVTELVMHLKRASDAYYNDKPIMSDVEFDMLRNKLEQIDPEHPFLSEVGAPVKKGGVWPEHKHRTLMGSLAKVKTQEEFMKWAEGKGDRFVLSEKYDGSTVVATYCNGKLQTLATRGNGSIGENITPNARYIKGVPQDLEHDFSGEIRGEAMLKISTFEKHFRPAGYSNPRNAANGKVRDMKDDPLKSHIEVMWFDIIPTDRDLKTEFDKWDLIASLDISNTSIISGTAEHMWEAFKEYRDSDLHEDGISGRASLDYEIDGLVVKVDDLDLQESFGISSNRPKGAIAIKFPSEEKETTITDIKWNRGLTGVICPTAHFEAIEIGGVNISRASLCGIEEIQRLDVAIGDQVIVSRRNDVIPKIERVVARMEGRPIHQPPTYCDLCKEKLVRDGAYILCLNTECQGEVYGNLMTWVKECRIKGIGPSVLRGLITEGVENVAHLYEAPPEVFEAACNSKKNGDKRFAAVQDTRPIKLSTFLSALNIRALGTTNGQRLEKKFETLDGVLNATVEDLQEVPGIKTNAKKIAAGLKNNRILIERLRALLDIQNLDTSGPLAGKSFCITGDLSLPRPKIQDWIKSQGGEIKSGVSKVLNYLITSDPESGTSKNKKADKYGIPKISEDQLYELAGTKP